VTAAVALIVLLVVLGSSIAVAAGMGLVGVILNQIYSPMPLTRILGELTWSTTSNFILTAIPFYIMFGEILLRSGTAERMYNALVQWLSWLPGGLMHSNIGSCALFGSVSGSSVATAATIGVVAMGEIDKHKYNEPLFLGTLAAGGTLGILIPPSINMIIYGVMTDTSVPKLYLAGFVPGLMLTLLFSLTVLIACLWKPQWGGNHVDTDWEARIRTLPDLLPPLVLLMIVIGAIFFGIATATESAAVGIVGALALTAWRRRLTLAMLRDVCEATVRTTAMVVAILVGAFLPERGHPDDRADPAAKQADHRLSALAGAGALGCHRPLSGPRDVHGGAVDDDRHHPDHHASDPPRGLRSGLVRHPHRAAHPDRDGDPSLRHQPVRHPWHPRPGNAHRCRARRAPVRHRLAADDRSDLRLSGHRDVAAATFRMSLRGNPPRRGAYNAMTMLPAASFSARAPGGTTQVASYSSTISGPARLEVRSARLKTGVSSQPCSSPK
jgi:tripartite ATP-independent transporter DctM subunit